MDQPSTSSTASNALASIKAPPRNFNPRRNDPVSVGFELVGTPALSSFLGFLLDRALGTGPLFALSFAFLGGVTVVGLVMWRYNNEMAELDTERRDTSRQRGYRPARWDHTTTSSVSSAPADPAVREDVPT
ncbi:MAG: AtpZ/AtpI family protein [Acidimicrobiia bacterium]|nr:AtpZ/AtpI family protein [Acidimicrobiia bacterium]